MSETQIEVVLVDDDALVRKGLADWLSSVLGIAVVGEASDVEGCLEVLKTVKPDIALIDIILPGISGIELVKLVSKEFPAVKCVILSGSMAPELVFDAFKCGAWGYLPKMTSVEEIRVALGNVKDGNWYLSPFIVESVLRKAMAMRAILPEFVGSGEETPLTDREREVLKLIAEGNPFTEIARQLSINSRSVERLKDRIEEKIGAQSMVDLIRKAIKLGLIRA